MSSAVIAPMTAMLISGLLSAVALLEKNRPSHVFGLLAMANAFWATGDVLLRSGMPAGIWIVYLGNLAIPPLLLLLAAVMTRGSFTPVLATTAISLAFEALLVSAPPPRVRMEQGLAVYLALSLAFSLYHIGGLVRCADSRVARVRLRALVVGVAVAGFGGLLNYANEFGWNIRETGAGFNAVGAAIIAASALRYGIFDLGRLTAMAVGDILLGVFFFLWAFAAYEFGRKNHLPPTATAAVSVIVGLPAAGRMRRALGMFLGSLFLSEPIDGAALRLAASRELMAADTEAAAYAALLRGLNAISKTSISVYNTCHGRIRRVAGGAGPEELECVTPEKMLYEDEIPSSVRMKAPRAGVLAPLAGGALLMLEKRSGRPFFETDRALVDDLTGMATMALERIRESSRRAKAEEEALAAKLAAGVAHDVLNPVGAISGAAEMLLKRDPDDEFAGIVRTEAARVERICRDFLEYGRPFPLERRACNLRRVLERAAATIRADAGTSGTEIAVEGEGSAFADEDALYRLATNLLRNAVKSGALRVVASCTEGEFSVDDDGPGVPADEREHLWEPYRATRSGGTGLGLPLARKIAEAHGGSITAETSAMGGARFTIRIGGKEERA